MQVENGKALFTNFFRFIDGTGIGIAELRDEYWVRLCVYVARITGSEIEAEDIVSDCLMEIGGQAVDAFASKRALQAWLYTVVRNASFQVIKARKKQKEVLSRFQYKIGDLDEDNAVISLMDKEMFRTQVYFDVVEALKRLPEHYRSVIELKLDGLSEQAIAAKLGISISTVKGRRMRGIALLRAQLPRYSTPVLLIAISSGHLHMMA